jgi:PIN domain nuclease of toxin-antitoxin system
VNLLLDTHVFLWWSTDSRKLTAPARKAITSAAEVYVSAASAWEVAIKIALGRLQMDVAFTDAVRANAFRQLAIGFSHAAEAGELPAHHADPFDRMLIAQARVEGLMLVTHDRSFEPYDIPTIWT